MFCRWVLELLKFQSRPMMGEGGDVGKGIFISFYTLRDIG